MSNLEPNGAAEFPLLFALVFYVALHERKVESKPATDVTSCEYSWVPLLLLSYSIQALSDLPLAQFPDAPPATHPTLPPP